MCDVAFAQSKEIYIPRGQYMIDSSWKKITYSIICWDRVFPSVMSNIWYRRCNFPLFSTFGTRAVSTEVQYNRSNNSRLVFLRFSNCVPRAVCRNRRRCRTCPRVPSVPNDGCRSPRLWADYTGSPNLLPECPVLAQPRPSSPDNGISLLGISAGRKSNERMTCWITDLDCAPIELEPTGEKVASTWHLGPFTLTRSFQSPYYETRISHYTISRMNTLFTCMWHASCPCHHFIRTSLKCCVQIMGESIKYKTHPHSLTFKTISRFSWGISPCSTCTSCLMALLQASSSASRFVWQKTMARPWLPL